jgi:hypothetical protein
MWLNYYLCNYLIVMFGDLLVSWISYFNYDLVIVSINVYWFSHDNSYEKSCEKS